jgi:plasmid maintenance system antidote protein VapI
MELVRYIHLNLIRARVVKGLVYSGAEVARYLGVSGSCVTRIVAGQQLTEDVILKYQNGQARSA